jgi:hypothetical protein
MNNHAPSITAQLSEAAQEQRFFPAGRQRLDPAELERLRQRDRETRLSFAAMRRSADAYLRSQRL